MDYYPSTSWLAASHRGPTSLKKTMQAYKAHCHKLNLKLDQLLKKKRDLEDSAYVLVDHNSIKMSDVSTENASDQTTPVPSPAKGASSPIMPTGGNVVEEGGYYHGEDISLVSKANDILIQSIELRLSYVEEAICHLRILYHDNPRMKVPPELNITRYEEWVKTNQRLFELNSQLYDLEKLKYDRNHKDILAKQTETPAEDIMTLGERIGKGDGVVSEKGEEVEQQSIRKEEERHLSQCFTFIFNSVFVLVLVPDPFFHSTGCIASPACK